MVHTPVFSAKVGCTGQGLMAAAAGGAAAGAAAGGGLHGHGVAAIHGGVDDGVNVADHGLALRLGGIVADHALAGHDLAVQVVDALVQLGHAGGVGLGLGALVVQIQAGQVELTDEVLQFFVAVVLARQDLAELKGKHYQPKRNHVNKFRKEYRYNYEPLTPDLIPVCLQFESEWCMKHGYIENENIRNERRALTYALHHFEELDLTGAVISVDGKIAAFTFGAPISHNTFGVHYEKADINIDGIYSAINQEFASHLPEQYIYLNREEDLGIPGLRQAKLSYHPVLLLEKTKAIKRQAI